LYTADLFTERVALVTGGAGGIGQAVAQALIAHGAHVISADRVLPSDFADQKSTIEYVQMDVTRSDDIHRVVNEIIAHHGRLDILVTVAGVVSVGSAEKLREQEWDRVIDINLKGTFLCCQAVIPIMKQQQFGRIITFGSVLGKNGGNPRPWIDPAEQDRAGNVAYGVSKAGVHIMTSYLAKELANKGITVNSIAPGPIASAMTTSFPETLRALIPVGRMGQSSEVAQAVLFLASPHSGFITGEILDVNGGLWSD
jgi:NAD(P)-dependent dehydrogenase (short-subunit alcohol dehydrogenase family)